MPKFHVGQTGRTRFEIDSQLLTKHAIIIGATGSGKTVLSKVIVEEAALQGIPTFAIDPKGDIGNLAFKSANFDFSRWSAREADALKVDRNEYAKNLQKTYADKMGEFSVDPKSAHDFANVTVRIFTPKSSAGLSIGISPDLSAPKDFASLLESDPSSAADLLDLVSYNLLRLAGYGESERKEITFVSALLEDAWKNGQSLTVEDLIRRIENPPIDLVGSLPVSRVVGDRERRNLTTRINLLLSDPKLRAWSSAEPFNFSELMQGSAVNVLDLRNIQSEQEKHLFVELVLQQLFQWLIKQGSAQTLRYLLYFDEIAGYCPPVREPRSKKLLLLLIKQARAFGLGLVLASQNAIDLDYKVISNANVRFIGRLGAQRDIQRVSVGLELDSFAEREIPLLKAGEFFCNIFDPKFRGVIKSRWPLTYHRGPLENSEISELMAEFKNKLAIESGKRQEQQETRHSLPKSKPPMIAEEPALPAEKHESFILLEKRFEPNNLASFIRLGNNLKSLKVLSVEQEERFHPVFELKMSVSEKTFAKQTLEKMEELAALDGQLVKLPEHTLTSRRSVPAQARKDAELWKGEIEKKASEMKSDLQSKFDIIMEEARNERIAAGQQKPKAKIADIDAAVAKLQAALNADADSVKEYEKLYKELKKEKKSKSRLISTQNKIETTKQKILSTRRKIEQLRTDRKVFEEKIRQVEQDEKERFHQALANVSSKSSFGVTGWIVETMYRAKILVNDTREHYGDVKWSAYIGAGTWGRCSSCSIALEEGSVCSCGNLLCNSHLAYCKTCLEPACREHRALCSICNSSFCVEHSMKCEICGLPACRGHSGVCSVCNRKVCNNCSQKKGLIKREVICRACSG
jgi:hypothetical protein